MPHTASLPHTHTHSDALACRHIYTHTRMHDSLKIGNTFQLSCNESVAGENFCEFPSEMQSVQTMCVMHMQTRPRPRLSGLCFRFFSAPHPPTQSPTIAVLSCRPTLHLPMKFLLMLAFCHLLFAICHCPNGSK